MTPTRRARSRVIIAAAIAVALVTSALVSLYGRQILSAASHLTGSPTSTKPIEQFPPGQAPELRLAVLGDVGYANDREHRTAAAVFEAGRGDPYDALVLLGDNVYPSGDPARLDETVFTPFGDVLGSGAQLLAILGNHDVKQDHADAQIAALGMPGPWYARQVGDVTFVALDSNRPNDPQQRAWLEGILAAAKTTWKIVALHHPPYSAGYQGSSIAAREAFSPLFEKYGVQLVLSGHEHDYQRSLPINGVTYVVSGGAADTRRTGREEFTAVSGSWHHFVDLSVFSDHLLLRAVNQRLRVFDEWSIASAAGDAGALTDPGAGRGRAFGPPLLGTSDPFRCPAIETPSTPPLSRSRTQLVPPLRTADEADADKSIATDDSPGKTSNSAGRSAGHPTWQRR